MNGLSVKISPALHFYLLPVQLDRNSHAGAFSNSPAMASHGVLLS